MTNEPEHLDLRSHDLAEDKKQELLRLFPEIRTEDGKIDFDRLKLALGETVDAGKERYGLNWPGKAECFKTIQSPSLATLRPCPEESVNFDTTENLIIEGDNLEVLKLLQKSYLGKVKMIYIDPPYNTGNDFIYPDNYTESLQTYLEYTGQVDAEGKKFGSNTEIEGRFHSKWLTMMYPRLYLARNLLREDGVILISGDDHEVSNLRRICDEVNGEENFVAQFVWNTEGHTDNQFDVKVNHEYVVMYAKNLEAVTLGHVVDPNTRDESNLWKGFAENSITKNGPGNPPSEVSLPRGFPCAGSVIDLPPSEVPVQYFDACAARGYITRELTEQYSVTYPVRLGRMTVQDGKLTSPCRVFSGWANLNKLRAFIENGCQPIDDGGDRLSFFLSERGVVYYRRDREKARNVLSVLRNMGTTERMRSELEESGIPFQYPKPKELLRYLLQVGMDDQGIVLDFFAGSATTAHAVLDLSKQDGGNRRFILVQLPEPTGRGDFPTISDIAKERVRRVIKKLNEEDGRARSPNAPRQNGLFDGRLGEASLPDAPLPAPDLGFRVFKLAESNFKPWDAKVEHDAQTLGRQLELHIDHIRDGRTPDDILYEILLKSGYPLTTPVETIRIARGDAETRRPESSRNQELCDSASLRERFLVYSVASGAMLICLERDLTLELIRAMADRKPERVVCLDEGFAGNDQLKANAVQIFKTKGVVSFKTV
ncbi:MAG: site-specific DNA-methyltransferase [Deltaproteobacteria bacterium]|nr:site-specific DNA-methyltransferase [Deltaproteobacteria bacterium]